MEKFHTIFIITFLYGILQVAWHLLKEKTFYCRQINPQNL